MSIIVKSGSSTNTADVTANSALKVALDGADPDLAGYAKILDSDGHPILTTENGALDVSFDAVVLVDQVDGTALNTNIWGTSTSTMTVTQSSGFINLNAAASTATNAYAILSSIKYIPLYGHLPLKATFNVAANITPQANTTMELGIGLVTTNAAPTDGCFFRWSSNGQFLAVVNNAGSETTQVITPPPTTADVTLLDVILVEDLVQFLADDVVVAEVEVPAAQAYPTNAGRLPVFARVYNGGSAPSAAPQLTVGQVVVVQQAMIQHKPWDEVLAGLGKGSHQSPITTFGQTANHANSASPTSATLSNTTPGYATLGGRYQFAAPAGAVTDFALFGYQVPTGYQLFVKRVRISCANMGAAVAISATVLDWALGVNGVTGSCADASIRRIPLGTQGFLLLAGIGTTAADIDIRFNTPVCVDSGRFLDVIVQVPVGTATASQVLRGDVLINGYFE